MGMTAEEKEAYDARKAAEAAEKQVDEAQAKDTENKDKTE
jgi:hypothetical protein